ncbi:hypothetical protein F0P96_03690 [Hymenobacter busanensis]|uniref:Uncharacterized protein n=1 Tax=Hymenobacter busanensis TaxID=2607656 RepID=A0A7L4ZU52_9BACT|nr:hypothetical protein [Hymenobacter busanensis]KAA9339729.1 hypothetical protein F0P96_03690 [Hymenobacter busanensis]QHJ06517.1 hypothetical protein GUY19_04060 [Hymenobacter busanensis]
MKTLRTIFLSVLALLVLSSLGGYLYFQRTFQPPANQLTVSRLPASCSFAWQADSSAQPVVPHAQMLVPVRVPGCARTCYLQFDTGAPYTLLYAHPLAALRARHPATQAALLPSADTVRNFQFALGRSPVQVRRLPVLRYGAHQLPADTAQPFVIGTLGTDALDGRVLVIDYARRRFTLDRRVSDTLARRTDFVPLAFDSRRVLLKPAFQGQAQQLMFDSGSSAFALLTSQSRWLELAQPTAGARTRPVNSWGKTLTAHTAPTTTSLGFGPSTVPLGTVTYIEGTSWSQNMMMRVSGMGGMLGNEPFAARIVVLDVSGGRFGVVRP